MLSTVERVDLYLIRLPLVHAFQTSSHRKNELEHIVVRVTDAAGNTGWGECASPSDPFYCAETVGTCWLLIHDYFAPLLVGGEPWEMPHEAAKRWSKVRGNQFARAALDMACHDLAARRAGLPLARLLGGTATSVPAGVSLGIEPSISALIDQVRRQVDAGYQRVKLKIGPGWDVEPVRAVRAEFGDELILQVDANGAYHATRAHTDALLALDAFGLAMIEQPYQPDDLLAHATLQQRLVTPVCLDESITSVEMARTALRLRAGRIINIKVSRLGGLGPARQVHDVCRDLGVPVWCGGMHEFGVGRAANVALASLPGFTLPSDVSGSDKYFTQDIVTPPIRAVDGRVSVPYDHPGIGHEVDVELVERLAARRATITPNR
jgi:O-succinylbenzoate synthase